MTKKTLMSSAVIAFALAAPGANADILLSDFSSFELSGTYVDWDFGVFSPGPDDWRVEATNFGGGWKFTDAVIDASAENQIEIIVTTNAANEAEGFNFILFSDAGGSDHTEAGWSFTLLDGTNTYVADLNNPDFYNRGDINTWDTSNLFDQWHLQGTFANNLPLDLTFDNLVLTPNGQSDCLRMSVSTLTAGEYALWTVSGVTPGEQVIVVYGTQPGQTNVNGTAGYCASFGIRGVNQKSILCRQVADAAGSMLCVRLLPDNVRGLRLLTQAAERNTCPDPCSSNLDDQIVQ